MKKDEVENQINQQNEKFYTPNPGYKQPDPLNGDVEGPNPNLKQENETPKLDRGRQGSIVKRLGRKLSKSRKSNRKDKEVTPSPEVLPSSRGLQVQTESDVFETPRVEHAAVHITPLNKPSYSAAVAEGI